MSLSDSGSGSDAIPPPKFDLSASDSDDSSSASPPPAKPAKKTKKPANKSDSDDDSSSQRESVKQAPAKVAKKAKKAKKAKVEKKQKAARSARKRGGRRLPAKLKVADELEKNAFADAVSLLADSDAYKAHLDILAKTEAACIIAMCYKGDERVYTTQINPGVFEPFGPFLSHRIVVNELVRLINTYLIKRVPVHDKETGEPRKNEDGSPVTRPVVNYRSDVESFKDGKLVLNIC